MNRKYHIDLKELEVLSSMQATQVEIAAWFSIPKRQLERWLEKKEYREAYERGRTRGLIKIRKAQFALADKGNATMLIWLGKQYLGQSDKIESKVDDGKLEAQRELIDALKQDSTPA
jgi:hypothetical protein